MKFYGPPHTHDRVEAWKRRVNTLDLGNHGGVPWRPTAPRHFLDRAVARALTPGQVTTVQHDHQDGENRD